MTIEVLKSKIHRVKITQAELHYVGSITIDEALMEAADIIENEKVQIVNINIVIIISYAGMEKSAARAFTPKVIFPDSNNRLTA